MLGAIRTGRSQRLSDRQGRIYNFLKSHQVGVLSTVTPNNNPHGTVVYYTIDEGFTAHILTKTGTRKYDNLVHNDHAMLTIYDPPTQTVAQISGNARERGGSNNIKHVAAGIFRDSLESSTSGLPPIMKLQAGSFTTFRIEPVEIRMAVYASPETGDYHKLFDTIESFSLND